MTAVVQNAYGLDALAIGERPVPVPGPGEVRIQVTASTVNPMDWHLATGMPQIVRLAEGFQRPRQEVPGREASGVVDMLGEGVTDLEVGQSVFGWVRGGFAEFAIAPAAYLCGAPTQMSAQACAALPIAGATALEAIEAGDVSGRRVLINGASGGVGHYAVQIAKAVGAHHVAGVCSSRNVAFVRSLGADQVIAYDTHDFTRERWDVIIDCVGNRDEHSIRRALTDHGCWVVVGDKDRDGWLGPLPRLVSRLARWKLGTRTCHWFVQKETQRYLHDLVDLVDNGHLRTHLDERFTLASVPSAYARIESRRSVGKLGVDVTPRLNAP